MDTGGKRVRSQVRASPQRRPSSRRRDGLLVLALGGAWFVWRNPAAARGSASARSWLVMAFRSYATAASMRSSSPARTMRCPTRKLPGWMFPHHEAGMSQMLRDGIRALLIDVHYGFAGGCPHQDRYANGAECRQ